MWCLLWVQSATMFYITHCIAVLNIMFCSMSQWHLFYGYFIACKETMPTFLFYRKLTASYLTLYLWWFLSCIKLTFIYDVWLITSPLMSWAGGTLICYQHWVVTITETASLLFWLKSWWYMTLKHFLHYSTFLWRIHRSPAVSRHNGPVIQSIGNFANKR